MKILGLSCFYHDAAAALLVDGELVAAAHEERFSRVKNDSRFPSGAVEFCLRRAGIDATELDAVAFYERPLLKLQRTVHSLRWGWPGNARHAWHELRSSLGRNSGVRDTISAHLGITPNRIVFVPHHLSHAASAFLPSGMAEAAVLTIDGVGEWSTATICAGRSATSGATIEPVGEIRFPHSLGLLYSTFTQFCGFEVNEGEYKLMGLAPYGSPTMTDRVRRVIDVADDGSFRLDLRFFDFLGSRRRMFSADFVELFGEPSPGNDGSVDPRYADVAASVQQVTEETVLAMAAHAVHVTGCEQLCLAGGVALNSVAVGRISREAGIDRLFVQPAAGDAGGALGAALYAHHVHFGAPTGFVLDHPSWGPDYSDLGIETLLRQAGVSYDALTTETAAERAAELLCEGKVIALHQGRSEWGPRALGNRSILADPRRETTKSIVNARVKYREAFRPFAPAILEPHLTDYLEFDPTVEPLPVRFMATVHPLVADKRNEVPAVDHRGTARPQAVGPWSPPLYRNVIERFAAETGVPVVLNTSFNVRGEPMVESPADALRTFDNSGIDALFIGGFMVQGTVGVPRRLAAVGSLPDPVSSSSRRRQPGRLWRKVGGRLRPTPLDEVRAAAPDMADYLPAEVSLHPYLFRADRPHRSTAAYSTDRIGFRRSVHGSTVIDIDTWPDRPRRGVVVGGSTAFGTGASSDATTVASLLASLSDRSYLNAAIRAVTSTHEVIASMYVAPDAQDLVVFSGFNNLGAALLGSVDRSPFSPFYGERIADALGQIRFDAILEALSSGAGVTVPPPAVGVVTPDHAAALAADAYRRDLSLLRSLMPPDARLRFALQPFAFASKPELAPEEQRSFDAMARLRPPSARLAEAVVPAFPGYTSLLSDVCSDLDISFVDLNELDYGGFCFYDAVHLTDRGNRVVAARLADA